MTDNRLAELEKEFALLLVAFKPLFTAINNQEPLNPFDPIVDKAKDAFNKAYDKLFSSGKQNNLPSFDDVRGILKDY